MIYNLLKISRRITLKTSNEIHIVKPNLVLNAMHFMLNLLTHYPLYHILEEIVLNHSHYDLLKTFFLLRKFSLLFNFDVFIFFKRFIYWLWRIHRVLLTVLSQIELQDSKNLETDRQNNQKFRKDVHTIEKTFIFSSKYKTKEAKKNRSSFYFSFFTLKIIYKWDFR